MNNLVKGTVSVFNVTLYAMRASWHDQFTTVSFKALSEKVWLSMNLISRFIIWTKTGDLHILTASTYINLYKPR